MESSEVKIHYIRKHHKEARHFALKLFILVLFLGVVAVGIFDISKFYDQKILPNTTISGIRVGGKTKAEAKIIVDDYISNVNKTGPQLVYKETKFKPKLSDLGITFDEQKTLDEAYNYGRQGNFFTKIDENIHLAIVGHNVLLTTKIDETKMTKFVDSIIPIVNVDKVDRKVLEEDGTVVDEGKDGQTLDKDKLLTDLKNQFDKGKVGGTIAILAIIIPRGTQKVSKTFVPGQYFYGKRIEVNLSEQTLYAYENEKLVKQFLISSGIAKHPTILGVYYVYGKNSVAEMKGDSYDLKGVQWVSWWHGDYSIHGTYWHHNFGHPMSHGCLNASNDDAKWIYDWDSIGTPVWVHK